MKYYNVVAWLFVSSLLIALPAVSKAQVDTITLRDAIVRTLDNNPQFRMYTLRERALEGEMQIAGLNPALNVSAELENVVGTGDLNWFQGTELTLALSQIIELGNKRTARTNVVSRRQSLLAADQQVMELELLAETTRRYIDLAGAQQMLELLSRSTALASENQATIAERVSAGRSPEAELARATAALRMAELAEQSAQFDVEGALINLSSLWGLLNPDFSGVSANLLEIADLEGIDSLLVRLTDSPAILVFADEERLRQAELREIQSRARANIQVGAGIRYLAELNDTAFTVQASIPLGNKKRNRGAMVTAQANLELVEAEREVALLRMRSQLLRLDQLRQRAANEVLVIEQSVLPQLTTAMDETREAFDSGRYGYVEFTAAQRDLLNAEISQINAAIRVHQLTAEIERLSGESLTEQSSGVSQ